MDTESSRVSGSSPLARGLPQAGLMTDPQPVDHPRSRGVYTRARPISTHPAGSSPLARGLLEEAGDGPPYRGIIPARAGFTVSADPATGTYRDHPRSRGVYGTFRHAPGPACGSSPLARGLQSETDAFMLFVRIIPARAGFTVSEAHPGSPPRDHPRSRGVYASSPTPPRASPGSSPLARGLHTPSPVRPPAWRIIPARAGFTR